ncbi:MAG: hypothetical protein R2854_27345 [Caldilineaceae bacterium]
MTGPDSVTQVELAEAMLPFALLDSQGEFSITRRGREDRACVSKSATARLSAGHLHFAWTVTGDELTAVITGQVLSVTPQRVATAAGGRAILH